MNIDQIFDYPDSLLVLPNIVFTPTSIDFYKNGVCFSFGIAPVGQATGYKLQIGWNPGFDEYFQGKIDEVRIWNIARTQEEIQADMNQPIENP